MALIEGRKSGGGTGIRIGPLTTGVPYEVGVRFVNVYGVPSAWVKASGQVAAAGGTTAPAAPVGVAGVPGAGSGEVQLTWTDPVLWLSSMEIWMGTVNDSALAEFQFAVLSSTAEAIVSGLAALTTYYFWLRIRLGSGTLSPFHTGQTAGLPVITT